MKITYLDNAATTPLDKEVLDEMLPFMTEFFGNPSSTHQMGRKSKAAIEKSRRIIAKNLNCLPSEIFFLSGGTEADNLALISSVVDQKGKRIILSPIEHPAVLLTAEKLQKEKNVQLDYVKLLPEGKVDLSHLEELLQKPVKTLVSLMHGNNEIGTLLPLKKVSELCQKYEAIFHSDTVQTMAHYSFDLQKINVHFITGSAHKFHGPKGIGFLYVNKNHNVSPIIVGGGQERKLRGGTENLYGIVGLGKAFDLAFSHQKEHEKHIRKLKNYMVSQLKSKFKNLRFNGNSDSEDNLYTVLSVNFPEHPNASMLTFLLDMDNIACSAGSACSSGAVSASHVLTALENFDPNRATIRFSFSRKTTRAEIDRAVGVLEKIFLAKEVN